MKEKDWLWIEKSHHYCTSSGFSIYMPLIHCIGSALSRFASAVVLAIDILLSLALLLSSSCSFLLHSILSIILYFFLSAKSCCIKYRMKWKSSSLSHFCSFTSKSDWIHYSRTFCRQQLSIFCLASAILNGWTFKIYLNMRLWTFSTVIWTVIDVSLQ